MQMWMFGFHIVRNGKLWDQKYGDGMLRPHLTPYAVTVGDSFLEMNDSFRSHTNRLMENKLQMEVIQHMERLACSSYLIACMSDMLD